MGNEPKSYWDRHPDQLPTVLSLWNQGYSASQILVALGNPRGLSRCAVLGKKHTSGHRRMGPRASTLKPKRTKENDNKKPKKAAFIHPEPIKVGDSIIDLPKE